MKAQVVTGQDHAIGPWVMGQLNAHWFPGHSVTIGLAQQDEEGGIEILAGVLYYNFNKVNVDVTIAGKPGKRWLTRDYLWYIFYYPFVQLKCRRLTAAVAASNTDSVKFVQSLGFTLEATLKDSHPDGDTLIFMMSAAAAQRWVNLKERKCASTTSFKSGSGLM